MPKPWVMSAHPDFLRALRQIPRGTAGLITDAIRRLQLDPTPPIAEPVLDRPNLYQMELYGYLVFYEVLVEQNVIHLLLIEQKPQ
jgi:mRNA-degrading endonuclease RelE of RelBE toxin-antitoxin system